MHNHIKKLSKLTGIPYQEYSKEEEDRNRKETEARSKRLNMAGTEENYRKMFHRDPWTDEWLGPGPEEPLPFLEDDDPEERVVREKEERKKELHLDTPLKEFTWNSKEKTVNFTKPKKKKKVKKRPLTKEEQENYNLAYWYLEECLKPYFAEQLYAQFDDVESLVKYCSDVVKSFIKHTNMFHNHEITFEEAFANEDEELEKQERMDDFPELDDGGMFEDLGEVQTIEYQHRHLRYIDCDPRKGKPKIPRYYQKEYDKFCKKHPLEKYRKKGRLYGIGADGMRMCKFLKKINKRNEKEREEFIAWKPEYMLYMHSPTKEDIDMDDLIQRQNKRFLKHQKKVKRYLDECIARRLISPEVAVELYPIKAADEDDYVDQQERIAEYYHNLARDYKKCRKIEKKMWDRFYGLKKMDTRISIQENLSILL